jgi:hypothetical protein
MRGFLLPHRLRSLCLALLIPAAACTGTIEPHGKVTGAGSSTGSGNSTGTPGTGNTGVVTGTGGSGVDPTGFAGMTGTGVDPVVAACMASNGVLNAGLTPARRLTHDQFNNTVRDLLGATGSPADALAPDEQIGPFDSNAIAVVDETLVQQHQEVAAKLAEAAKARMTQISPCNLANDTGTTCATQFVTEFGKKAYRRPLDSTEIQKYVSLYTLGKTGLDAANGFRLVVEAMLQSPFFLYHHDVGANGTPQPGTVKLTGFELAARLSYFLWNSMPDDTLFGLAQNGTLGNDTVLSAQVDRMLASDKAGTTIALFHREWLDVTELPSQTKEASLYPSYNAQLVTAMMSEVDMFSDYVVRRGDGLLKTLLTSNMAFPQGGLFNIYGVSQPANFKVGDPVMLDANRRAGILTQAAFLTRWAHGNQTSPVHRGKLVRRNIMCGYIPPPPPTANTNPPPPTAATSTRQRFDQHRTNPDCRDCHQLMDPIGLGFEHFDAIGNFRTMDGTASVDATGEIISAGPDLQGTFDGAIELANKLANSQEVNNCFANQWFRFSLGRMETTNDACSLQSIREGFRSSGGNIRMLLSQIALSPAFRNVRVTTGG